MEKHIITESEPRLGELTRRRASGETINLVDGKDRATGTEKVIGRLANFAGTAIALGSLIASLETSFTSTAQAQELIAREASGGNCTGVFLSVPLNPWHALLSTDPRAIFADGHQRVLVPLDQIPLNPKNIESIQSREVIMIAWDMQAFPAPAEETLGAYKYVAHLLYKGSPVGPAFLADPFEGNTIVSINWNELNPDGKRGFSSLSLLTLLPEHKQALTGLVNRGATGTLWLSIVLDAAVGFFDAQGEVYSQDSSLHSVIINAEEIPLALEPQISVSFGNFDDFMDSWNNFAAGIPQLSVTTPRNGYVTFSWPTQYSSYVLVYSSQVKGKYSPVTVQRSVAGNNFEVTIPTADLSGFYRLSSN